VFADHLTGSFKNLVLDDANDDANVPAADSEGGSSTTTDAQGNFTLNEPDYAYQIVSIGGTDLLTKEPAMQMLAPAGAQNISPFTTLVAMTPEGADRDAVIANIESLGINYDEDLSKSITPAAAVAVHSIQTAVTSVTDALTKDPTTGAQTQTTTTVNKVQNAVLKAVAKEFTTPKTVEELTDSDKLSTSLETATADAITELGNDATITTITITAAASTAMSSAIKSATKAVADTIIAASGKGSSSADKKAESEIVTPAVITLTQIQTSTAATSATDSGGITVTAPSNETPTIAGSSSPLVATKDASFTFKPTARDANAGDTLTFSYTGTLPPGLTFNSGTGAISGTPTSSGSFPNIVITVSDGLASASTTIVITVNVPTTGGSGAGQ
jgi:hypothetical protein